jgi:putative copper resistance protein D
MAARFILVTSGVGMFGWASFALYASWAPRPRAPAALRALAPLAAVAAGLVWIVALAREAAGAPGLPDLSVVLSLCLETGFGRALAVAVALSLLLAVFALSPRRPPMRAVAYASGGLLTSLAFVGHAAGVGGVAGALRIGVMAAHLLLAGVWLGGLLPLALALRKTGAETERLLRQFGNVALTAVAGLVTSGMIAAAVILGMAARPPGPVYLTAFGIKLGLAAALLGAAAVNRWAITPLAARSPAAALRGLRWSLGAEQLLALALLAAVARLAQLDPGL